MAETKADDCVIKEDDERLKDQSIEFRLNNMKCRLRIETAERRSSVYETPDTKSKYVVHAALVVTKDKLLLDVKRADKDSAPKQYLSISYKDALFKELVLEYSSDPKNPQLSFLLPDAGRFLSSTDLGVAEKCAVTVFMSTHKAPDIAMFVNSTIRCQMGEDCSIQPNDPRLVDQKVAYLLNSMKCQMQVADSGKRSSIYGTSEAPSRHTVFAALAVTDQKIILDVKWLKDDAAPRQYLCLAYSDKLCCDLGLEFTNDQKTSNLVIVLPNAAQFFGPAVSELGVADNSTVKVYVDTWKAPDIAMFVKQKLRKIHGASRASVLNANIQAKSYTEELVAKTAKP